MSSWVTTGSKNIAKSTDINVANGSFTASLPAQSVTTFVGDLRKQYQLGIPYSAKAATNPKVPDEKYAVINNATAKIKAITNKAPNYLHIHLVN